MNRVLALLAALALLAGCASSGAGAKSGSEAKGGSDARSGHSANSGDKLSGTITVDAAASLTEAFTTLKKQFEQAHPGTTITLNFGASSDLATQIDQGAPVDVFASASKKNMTALGATAVDPKDFAANTAEIAVPPDNPAKITGFADLANPGIKVAVCAAAVPCGVVATEVFHNAKITVRPAASLADVKSTLAAVESGEVDAGVVYVTDVRSAGAKVQGVEIPAAVNASTAYPIARLKNAKNPGLAQAWVDYVLSASGRTVLQSAGFRLP